MKTVFLVFLWVLLRGIVSIAQTDVMIATAHTHAALYMGPGDTYLTKGVVISPSTQVTIIARNRIGNWLKISRDNAYEGWVMKGYFQLNPTLRLSEVPVNNMPDGDPTYLASATQKILAEVPVIPTLSPLMQLVYETGREMGNNPQAVSKVGDSVMANPLYLKPFSQPDVTLGNYDYLDETVRYYGASLAQDSVSAQVGMTTYVVFDSLWANFNPNCEANETPLACEYRIKKPSVAFVMFGANDIKHMTFEQFGVQMRQIVQETMSAGVIPVLSTFSVDTANPLYQQGMRFNLEIVNIAQELRVPVINFWLASRPLPAFGLDIDGVHPLQTGFTFIKLDSGMESWYGVGLQNLLAIRTLDEIRRTLELSLAG